MKSAKGWKIAALGGALGLGAAMAGGCTIHHEVETPKPVEVNLKIAPIEATVNVNVRIQREVNDLYDSIYGSATPTTKPAGA